MPYTQHKMALPPTIPTSFVPHPAAAAVRRRTDLSGAFAFFGYGVLGIVVLIAIGVFVYASILSSDKESKDAALDKAVAQIDPTTVESFVHLRDRLSAGEKMLDRHPAFTHFFAAIGGIVPATVRFSSLHLSVEDSGAVRAEVVGVAKSFNALAAASDALSKDGRIKDAIFSGIKVSGNAVSFTLSATIDPSLVAFTPPALPAIAPPVASTTAPVTSAASTTKSKP